MPASSKGSLFNIVILIVVGFFLITYAQNAKKEMNRELDKAEKASRESMIQGIKLDKARLRGEVSDSKTSSTKLTSSTAQAHDLEKAREEKLQKLCIKNMRMLTGAIKKHNATNQGRLSSIDPNVIAMLKSKGYLKDAITPPTPLCEYYPDGDLTKAGVVACPLHGPCSESD